MKAKNELFSHNRLNRLNKSSINKEQQHRPNESERSQSSYRNFSESKRRNFSTEYAKLSNKFRINFLRNRSHINSQISSGRDKRITGRKSFITPSNRSACRVGSFLDQANLNFRETLRQNKLKRASQMMQPPPNEGLGDNCRLNQQEEGGLSLPRIYQGDQYSTVSPKPTATKDLSIQISLGQTEQLLAHFKKLFQLKESIEDQRSNKQILLLIKCYIVGQGQLHQDENQQFFSLDALLNKQSQKKNMRGLVCLQRCVILGCIDSILRGQRKSVQQDTKHLLQSIIGVYFYFFASLMNRSDAKISEQSRRQIILYSSCLQSLGYHIKKDLISTNVFLFQRIPILFRHNPHLLTSFRKIFQESYKVSARHSLYDLLSVFSLYLNFNEKLMETVPNTINQLATSPAPYLTSVPKRQYTLVIDLDGTLIHQSIHKQSVKIAKRPYCEHFLSNVAEHYEIVVFTTALPNFASEFVAQCDSIEFCLYRQYTVRQKKTFNSTNIHQSVDYIKDLSRLGRPLSRIVAIDNQKHNFRYQPQNCIQISTWKGSPQDQALLLLQNFLLGMIEEKVVDVREPIKQLEKQKNFVV